MQSTKLSTILARMQRWQTVSTTEEQYLVYDIDEAIREARRNLMLPWNLKRSTLRVFDNVLEYPVASDHDELAYLDDSKKEYYPVRARFRYTSLKEFYEDPNNRNDLAEIWDGGEKYLGVRYNSANLSSVLIDNAEDSDNYTASDDATAVAEESVVYKKGNGSIKVSITNSSGTATVTISPTSLSDSNYKRKYIFAEVYLDSAPTSITIRYGNDSSNYFYSTLTTQFSGQAFKVDDWNLLAFDLNDPTGTVGTVDSSAFDYAEIIFTGAATGTYYIDQIYLRSWALMNYWYYSTYGVKTEGSSVLDRKYFMDADGVYSISDSLVADDDWVDIVMYNALITSIDEKENKTLIKEIKEKRNRAWGKLLRKYPSLEPLITTSRWNMTTDFNQSDYYDY